MTKRQNQPENPPADTDAPPRDTPVVSADLPEEEQPVQYQKEDAPGAMPEARSYGSPSNDK